MILVWLLIFIIGAESKPKVRHAVEGKPAQISCQSTDPFFECKWTRPNNLDSCLLFENENPTKQCETDLKATDGTDIKVDPWSISMKQDNSCYLNLTKVSTKENGIWACTLEDTEGQSVTDTFEIRLLKQPTLKIDAPQTLTMTEQERKILTCQVETSDLEVPPSSIQWAVNDVKLDGGEGGTIEVLPLRDWKGKSIECSVTQTDSFGNIIITTDSRDMRILPNKRVASYQGKTTKAGQFRMANHYPQNEVIVLAKDVSVTFTCETSSPWLECKWKHPSQDVPCEYHYMCKREQ